MSRPNDYTSERGAYDVALKWTIDHMSQSHPWFDDEKIATKACLFVGEARSVADKIKRFSFRGRTPQALRLIRDRNAIKAVVIQKLWRKAIARMLAEHRRR